jgi:uncharacterized protein (TIGR03118 family)
MSETSASKILVLATASVAALGAAALPARADQFAQTNLVSNVSGALETDPNLVNPWGMSFSASSPIWVSDQASGVATLYNALPTPPVVVPLVVTIPPAGTTPPTGPTGQVFNSTTSDFQIPAPGGTVQGVFLFDTLDGTIQGWNPGSIAGMNASEQVASVPGAVFTGLALGASAGANFLYAANATGGVSVFDKAFTNVTSTTFAGKFVDPNSVGTFTPFNIQKLNGDLFVTYAAATATGAPLPGGYVDEFDTAGDFIKRIATGGPINAPWGLTIAPSGFGAFGGDLLVGNLYDSKIDAYNLTTDQWVGSFAVNTGFASPVGLWALDFGNGTTGSANTLYFTAGINDQKDGLFGSISVSSVPEPSTWALMLAGFGGLGVLATRRRRPTAAVARLV